MNKSNLKQRFLGVMALLALVSATETHAQQTQQNLNVTAVVPSICTIDASTETVLTFNLTGLDNAAGAPLTFDNEADINWRCSIGTAIDISATAGDFGTYAQRLMDDGSATGVTLPYNLYTDNSYGTVWGDPVVDGATDYISGTGTGMGNVVSSTVFGRIDLADVENVPPGTYNDDVTVDITF